MMQGANALGKSTSRLVAVCGTNLIPHRFTRTPLWSRSLYILPRHSLASQYDIFPGSDATTCSTETFPRHLHVQQQRSLHHHSPQQQQEGQSKHANTDISPDSTVVESDGLKDPASAMDYTSVVETEISTSTTTTTSTTSTTTSTSTSAPTSVSSGSSPNSFNYLLAASWHPKSRHRRSHEMPRRGAAVPTTKSDDDPLNRWKRRLRAGKVDAGEDAFFHVSTPTRVALGVADGVGGWSEVGVDPALFSWALMDNAEVVARQTDVDRSGAGVKDISSPHEPLDAQTILDGAYTELVQSGKVEAGSSTACILSLCKLTGTLRASNLGDSAYLLIRDNRCIYESPSQQHFWNCPYQLTILPPGYPGAGAHVTDLPKDAAQTTHQLQDGDVIVLATDGFWDNVFTAEAIELVDSELGDVIKDGPRRGNVEDTLGRVRALSQRLTNTARRFSLDQKRRTPFSQGAHHIRSGGKIDDITVIVTLVRTRSGNEDA